MKKILFLAANPKGTARLRLDEELREIETGLQLAKNRDRFILESKGAVRPTDVRRAILNSVDPQSIASKLAEALKTYLPTLTKILGM